jgi:hypothetical protein
VNLISIKTKGNIMGIDVKLGYYRAEKVTSYDAIKHLHLAIKAGMGASVDSYGRTT